MLKQVSIKFFPRTDQLASGAKIPLYVRVILDREKFEFSSKQFIDNILEWDDSTQRVKKKPAVNAALSEVEHQVNEAYNFLKYHNKPLTKLALRNQLRGEKVYKQQLIDFYEDFYEKHIKNNKEYASATKKTYVSTLVHLKNFLSLNGKSKVRLTEIDLDFIKDFDSYLVNRSITDKKGLKKVLPISIRLN